MSKTMAEHLKEEGRQQGRLEGELESKRDWLIRLLRHLFGKVPAALKRRIATTDRPDLLDAWFDQALDALRIVDLSFTANNLTQSPRVDIGNKNGKGLGGAGRQYVRGPFIAAR